MVPPLSVRIPRVRTYSGYKPTRMSFAYRILTFSDLLSQAVRLLILRLMSVLTLKYVSIFKFGLLRFRSPLLTESRLISLPPPT